MDRHEFIADGVVYRLVRGSRRAEDFEAVPPREAAVLVRSWAHRDRGCLLRALSEVVGIASELGTHEDATWLTTRLSDELDRPACGATLLRQPRNYPPVDHGPLEIVDLGELAEDIAGTDDAPAEHWIEIRLVDEAAQPIAGERYELELPDGRTREGRTDEHGIVRVDPVHKPGNCRIYFPELEAQLQAAG